MLSELKFLEHIQMIYLLKVPSDGVYVAGRVNSVPDSGHVHSDNNDYFVVNSTQFEILHV